MSEYRTVMYIGTKSRKYDSANQVLSRVWPGTGTIVPDIPVVQAANLVSHIDEFIDVTSYDPDQLQSRAKQAVGEAEESLRKARALGTAKKMGGGKNVLLEYATDEQLEEEVATRKERQTLAAQVVKPVKQELTPAEKNLKDLTDKQRQDSDFLAERIPEAIETVIGKNQAELLDDNGLPLKEAIEEALGFSITEDSYAQALDLPAHE